MVIVTQCQTNILTEWTKKRAFFPRWVICPTRFHWFLSSSVLQFASYTRDALIHFRIHSHSTCNMLTWNTHLFSGSDKIIKRWNRSWRNDVQQQQSNNIWAEQHIFFSFILLYFFCEALEQTLNLHIKESRKKKYQRIWVWNYSRVHEHTHKRYATLRWA